MENVIANLLKRQGCFVLSKQKFIYIGSTKQNYRFHCNVLFKSISAPEIYNRNNRGS